MDEFGQVSSGFELGVKTVKILVVVLGELCKSLFLGFDIVVCHFVVPFLREGHSFPNIHFTKDESDLQFIQVVDLGVD